MQALADTIRYAIARGLLVIADAKRNDIGTTAEAYADAFLGRGKPVLGIGFADGKSLSRR